jgi:hypothetical protein
MFDVKVLAELTAWPVSLEYTTDDVYGTDDVFSFRLPRDRGCRWIVECGRLVGAAEPTT